MNDIEPAGGNIDLTLLLRFSGTSDPSKTPGKMTFGGRLCPHPIDPDEPCGPEANAPFFDTALSFDNAREYIGGRTG